MLEINQQVVVRTQVNRSGPRTSQVRVGTITAFAGEEIAVVALAGPGGRVEKRSIPVDQLTPVRDVYRRTSVQVNPAFRQIHVGLL